MILATLLSCLFLTSVEAKTVPPPPKNYVWDEAQVIPDAVEIQLSQMFAEHARTTEEQVVFVVFKSLEGEDLVSYTHRVFQEWRIGKKGRDNGVLLALYWEDRKSRIEVGYGLEPLLTDAKSKRILNDELTPWLKQGQPGEALKQAAREILVTIGSPLVGAGQVEKRVAPRADRGSLPRALGIFLLVALFVFGRVLFSVLAAPVHITHGGVFGPRTGMSNRRFKVGSLGAGGVMGGLGGLRSRGGFGGGGFGGGGGGFGGFGGGGGRSGGGGASGSW